MRQTASADTPPSLPMPNSTSLTGYSLEPVEANVSSTFFKSKQQNCHTEAATGAQRPSTFITKQLLKVCRLRGSQPPQVCGHYLQVWLNQGLRIGSCLHGRLEAGQPNASTQQTAMEASLHSAHVSQKKRQTFCSFTTSVSLTKASSHLGAAMRRCPLTEPERQQKATCSGKAQLSAVPALRQTDQWRSTR